MEDSHRAEGRRQQSTGSTHMLCSTPGLQRPAVPLLSLSGRSKARPTTNWDLRSHEPQSTISPLYCLCGCSDTGEGQDLPEVLGFPSWHWTSLLNDDYEWNTVGGRGSKTSQEDKCTGRKERGLETFFAVLAYLSKCLALSCAKEKWKMHKQDGSLFLRRVSGTSIGDFYIRITK